MNITNTSINSSGSGGNGAAASSATKRVTNLGTINNKTDLAQVIQLTHSDSNGVTNIFANSPPNFNLELQAEWAQRNGAGTIKDKIASAVGARNKAAGAVVGRSIEATGMAGTTHKYLTAHYWEGSAPIRCTIPFEFIAEDDPDKQVVLPLVHLYKMAAPYEVMGALIPPGPSIAGTATGTGESITIKIGNILTFENVIINSVSGEIDTRLSFDGSILHAKVDVSFTSFFTVSRDDIVKIFGGKGASGGDVGVKN